MFDIFLFLLGLVVGSFLNVAALRYPSTSIIWSRSRCPHCLKNLSWYELIPLASFLLQWGKCRNCHENLSLQYPIVELFSGFIFLLTPQFVSNPAIWILAILTLLLIALIDLRLTIIPDGLSIFLFLLGIILIADDLGNFQLWLNHLLGELFGAGTLGFISLITKGKGMGIGDVKMVGALGFLFGWPAIVFLTAIAFITGGIFASGAMFLKIKNIKDIVPFGPFISLAGMIMIFAGKYIMDWYLGLLVV